MKRKLFCVWMCIAMIVTLMPSMAFADETSASPEVQAASTSNAIAGTIAVTRENEEEELEYEISSEQEEVMRLPYSTDWWFSFGTGDNGTFSAAENISEAEIIIKKAGKELGREKLSTENGFEKSDSIPGIDYGIWYYEEDNDDIAELYCNFHFDLGLDAYKYLTTLAGTYDITVNWVAGGQNYTASTHYTLKPGQAISELSSIGYNEEGFVKNIWSNSSNFGDSMIYTYNPLVSYYYSGAEDDGGDTEIVQKYIFTDCTSDGFFNFARCETEGLKNVFTKGDSIKYDADTELAPLYIHPRFITEEMIGKSATLIFKNGEIEKTITITIEKEANPSLTEGKLYAVRSWNVHHASETSDIIRIFCGDGGYTLSDLLETEIQLPMDESSNITFVTYQKQTLHQVEVADLSETDAEILEMTYSETDGVKMYRLTPLQCGDVNIKALTEDEGTIPCHIYLPETGFYYTPARTGENFIGDEFHYRKATEKKADGTEAYVYLIMPAYGYNAEQINVFCGRWNEATDAWEKETIDGITIDTPTIQNIDDTTYAICKITISQNYRNPNQNWQNLETVYNNGAKSSSTGLCIYDSTEILEEEQLYWFYNGDVNAADDGKLQLQDDTTDSMDRCANREENWAEKTCSISGYFAVKKGDGFYALQNVKLTETEGMALTVSDPEADSFLYTVSWTNFGTYHFAAETEGKEYRFVFNAVLPNAGFYSTGLRSESSYIEEEFHFINASEKSQDGTEAYFYLIATSNGYAKNQIKMEYGEFQWSQTLGRGVWTKKSLPTGISIGTPNMESFDDETYIIWRITVTNEYKNKNLPHQFKVSYNGEKGMHYEESIKIYDSSEIPRSEKLYWFGTNQVQATANGILFSEDGDINDFASWEWEDNSRSGAAEGYFAILLPDGTYQAIPSHEIIVPQTMRIYKAEKAYMSLVEWGGYGEHTITAIYNQQKYRTVWRVNLAEYGFFLSKEVSEADSIGCKFSFNYAKEKSGDGQEAYFYLIGDLRNEKYQASDIKIIIGELNNMHELQNGELEGVSFGEIETMQYEGKTYFICKVTVSKTFDFSDEIWVGMSYGQEEVENHWYGNLYIYGGNYFFGDADGNKKVDYSDVLYIKRYLAEWRNYQNISESADTNGTNDVEMDDLIILERHVAGWSGYAMLPYVDNLF